MNGPGQMAQMSCGSRPAYQRFAGRIGRVFGIQFYDLYYGQKELASPDPVVASSLIEVQPAKPADLDSIVSRIGGTTRQEFDRNIAINSVCHIALQNDTITGYLWVNQTAIHLIGMFVAKLPPGGSLIHNVYVFPEHRRQGVFRYLFREICNENQQAGFCSVSCLVDKANNPSVEAFKNEGIKFRHAPILKLPVVKPVLLRKAFA